MFLAVGALAVAGIVVFAMNRFGFFSNDNVAILPTPLLDAGVSPAVGNTNQDARPAPLSSDAAVVKIPPVLTDAALKTRDAGVRRPLTRFDAGKAAVIDARAKTDPIVDAQAKILIPPKPDDRTDPNTERKKIKQRIAAARSRAASQYRDRRFRSAATTLRDAAKLDPGSKRRLETLAKAYDSISSQVNKGLRNRSTNPITATSAFRKALNLDARHGRGANKSYLRAQLATTAPKAAATYMARKNYAKANQAAKTAAQYAGSSDATVRRIRAALDRRAKQLYNQANRLRKSNPRQARSLLREIQRIVPRSSRWARSAKQLASELGR